MGLTYTAKKIKEKYMNKDWQNRHGGKWGKLKKVGSGTTTGIAVSWLALGLVMLGCLLAVSMCYGVNDASATYTTCKANSGVFSLMGPILIAGGGFVHLMQNNWGHFNTNYKNSKDETVTIGFNPLNPVNYWRAGKIFKNKFWPSKNDAVEFDEQSGQLVPQGTETDPAVQPEEPQGTETDPAVQPGENPRPEQAEPDQPEQ